MESVSRKPLSCCGYSRFTVVRWLDAVSGAFLKRPLVFMLCMCLIGGYIAFYARPGSIILSVFFVSAAIVFFLYHKPVPVIATILAGTICFSFSFMGVLSWKNKVSRCCFPEKYEGSAHVVSSNASNDGYKNIVLQLGTGEKVIFLSNEFFDFGDALEISGTLMPIVTKGNPGDFDVRDYYLKKGIFRQVEHIRILQNKGIGYSLVNQGFKYGSYVRRSFYELWRDSTDERTASLLSAMIVGDDSHLEKEIKTSFKKSNLAHILVVSGAHVGYFSATIAAMSMYIKDQKKKIAVLSGFLVLFGFLTGWGGSASRSIFTYIIIGMVTLGKRNVDRISACALSALILILIDPFVLFSSGIILSFGAAFSISIFQRKAETIVEKCVPFFPEEVRVAVSCYICAQIGMLPALVSMGSSVSLINMVIVVLAGFPAETICGAGLILTVICSVIPVSRVARFLFVPVRGLIHILVFLADAGSGVSIGRIWLHHVPVLGLLASASLLSAFLVRFGFRRKLLIFAAGLAAAGVIVQNQHPDKESFVYFLDVGQGDSAIICHNGVNVLIDGGNPGNGEKIRDVMEYLGISRIDMAFISHLDKDHISGIIELWDMGLIDSLYASFWDESSEMAQLRAFFPKLPETVSILKKGDVISFDDYLSFQVIWPEEPVDGGNDDSLVLLCNLYEAKVLFTGDISDEVEQHMGNIDLNQFQVLKVSHHGSRFSTSGLFLENKKVDAAVISVGYNHYGHPSGEVLDRLRDNGIPWYRTDERGCIVLEVSDQDWKIDYYFGA